MNWTLKFSEIVPKAIVWHVVEVLIVRNMFIFVLIVVIIRLSLVLVQWARLVKVNLDKTIWSVPTSSVPCTVPLTDTDDTELVLRFRASLEFWTKDESRHSFDDSESLPMIFACFAEAKFVFSGFSGKFRPCSSACSSSSSMQSCSISSASSSACFSMLNCSKISWYNFDFIVDKSPLAWSSSRSWSSAICCSITACSAALKIENFS